MHREQLHVMQGNYVTDTELTNGRRGFEYPEGIVRLLQYSSYIYFVPTNFD